MRNEAEEEWHFDFGLCITKENQIVPRHQCEELLDLIMEWAESKDLGVGGGYRKFSQLEQEFRDQSEINKT